MKHELKLDADSPLKALRIAHKLSAHESLFPDAQQRRSSSGKGWHFRVKSFKTGARKNIKYRQLLGDCWGRLRADKIRLKLNQPTNVLFEWKNGKQAGNWHKLNIIEILADLKFAACDAM